MSRQAAEKISKRQVQYIQALRRRLGVSDELYDEMKRSMGVESTLDLTNPQLNELVRRLNGTVRRQARRNNQANNPTPGGKGKGEGEPWKPLHSSARASGMHKKPPADKEDMVRKIEAILTELKRPWSYADGMAKRMFGVDLLRWCDSEQTYKLLQALCVYQERLRKKDMTEQAESKDTRFYIGEPKSDGCQCGRKKQPGRSLCYDCYTRLPEEMRKALYRKLGNGYEEAYDAAVMHLDKTRHQYD